MHYIGALPLRALPGHVRHVGSLLRSLWSRSRQKFSGLLSGLLRETRVGCLSNPTNPSSSGTPLIAQLADQAGLTVDGYLHVLMIQNSARTARLLYDLAIWDERQK